MSEGNLLDQQQLKHHKESRKLFSSSRDSELELLDTTTETPSPEIRSRSQSVGSAHREALLFFEQHRLFQNSPELDFGKEELFGDCELRSISSASRTSSPAIAGEAHHQSVEKTGDKPNYQQRQQKSGNLSLHQQQVQRHHYHKNTTLRQQSDSNLLESSGSPAAAAAFLSNSGGSNQTNNSHSFDGNTSDLSGDRGGRARSQSQGQCGSLRRRQDSCSSVIVISTTNNKKGLGESNGTQKASKWLEEIQFKAQYQHYRTNNYASVVSSASSLDKSDGGTGSSGTAAVETGLGDQAKCGGYAALSSGSSCSAQSKKKNASEVERPSSSKAGAVGSSSSRHHQQFTKGCNEDGLDEEFQSDPEKKHQQNPEYINSDNLNRQNSITTSQCWNFPRVKLRKLFTAKSLDDILGGRRSSSASGSSSRSERKKSLQVTTHRISSSSAQEEFAQEEVSGERSSSSPEFIIRSSSTTNTKKAQLLRDNKLSIPRFQQHDDKAHLLLVKSVHDGRKSPGAHSSKSAIVISSTAPQSSKQQRKGPVFIKATRQKSRSFSALTTVLLSRVPGHSSSGANSPSSSTASSTNAGSSSGKSSIFFKRSHQDNRNIPPVVPPKKSGQVVPCAKSDNCLNRIVASATCAKFVDYFSAETSAKSNSGKSASSTTTLVEPLLHQSHTSVDHQHPGPSSPSYVPYSSTVVTAQPRKWTAIKNKWDQKLQASGDRQKEIGASLASVSNNAQIFRKTHHQPRQRSNSLSPLDNPEDGKSSESLLEITSPSPTLQEVRFLDKPEIRYASPIAVRSARGDYNLDDDDDDEDENNEDESVTLIEGATNTASDVITTDKDSSRPSSRASSACSTFTASSICSDCKESDINLEDEETDTISEMTRHHGNAYTGGVGGTKRSRDHHHRHHGKHHHSSSKEKPKLVVANVTYLQRPMSPGLVLKESSPSTSTPSGTIDSFSNLTGGSGNFSGAGTEPVGNFSSSSVIRNNNVFSNINNQPNSFRQQQSKSQQAKLEFLKSVSTPQTDRGLDASRRRDPLCANNTSIINVNERQVTSGIDYISPSSSGDGASDNRSSSSVGTNNVIIDRRHAEQGSARSSYPSYQKFLSDDLQDPFHTNRQRDHFTDSNVRSGTGDSLAGGNRDASKGYCGGKPGANSNSRGAPPDDGTDEENRRSLPPHYRGTEHFSSLSGNQLVSDSRSSDRHHSQGAVGRGVGDGATASTYESRSTDNQSSEGGGGVSDTRNYPEDSGGDGVRESSAPINQGPQTLAQQSSINNNLFIDVDFEGAEDTMGDLQSPQYVKRTAHMFDSRFSSEPGANGHERNGRNPSYLNVSRSVSGYSCMTYNNGSVTSETVGTKTVLGNGTSLLTAGTRVSPAAPRLKTDFSLQSPFTRNKVPTTDDDSSDHSSNQSATSPPPSLPPIHTNSSHGRYSDSPFFQNGMNRSDDLIDDTPYIPSHGKSFIMQRIERLYGSDAVSNKSVVSRKSSHVTTISITRESPTRGTERIIPIKVESRENYQNNIYNNGCAANKNEIIIKECISEDEDKMSSTKSAGVIIPIIHSNQENEHHVEPLCSRVTVEYTDEDEQEDRSAEKRRSPTKSMGHLNGNANRYRNDGSINGNEVPLKGSTAGNDAFGDIIHANGRNEHEDCTVMKKALSRESSAGSDDTNDCSENSLELGSASSSEESRKSVVKRQDSKEDPLYSTRGATSPIKPKPKPKPKDMALLRTLSRSPALKTGTENLDKTAISLSIVQPDAAATAVSVSKKDDNITISAEDQTDAANFSTLSDIKNTISAAAANSLPQGKVVLPPQLDTISDKENAHSQASEKIQSGTECEVAVATPPSSVVKDGNYFLNEMKKVTKEIIKLSEQAAKELDTIDPSEDRAGSIHAAIGKGNLLVKKKFKQFEELCQANLKGVTGDEPETTNEDLGGFWDMVLIQVEQIYSLFADLENKDQTPESVPRTPIKSASPKRMPPSTSKSTSKTNVGATPKVNTAAAKARDEARRKMLAERRKAMKNQMQDAQVTVAAGEPEAEVLIFAPETPHTG